MRKAPKIKKGYADGGPLAGEPSKNVIPVFTTLAEADSVFNQPNYVKKGIDIKRVPKDVAGALNHIVPVIKSGQSKLNSALIEYQKKNPDATELPPEIAAQALPKDEYKKFVDYSNVYMNSYRPKTQLAARPLEPGQQVITSTFGNSNSGGGFKQDIIPSYGPLYQNMLAPYVQKKADGGSIKKAPKFKKKGYADGTDYSGVNPDQLSPEERAKYDSLQSDQEKYDYFNSLTGAGTTGGETTSKSSTLDLGKYTSWLAYANMAKDAVKQGVSKDQYGNPLTGTNSATDEFATDSGTNALNEVKQGDYTGAVREVTGFGKVGRGVSDLLGHQEEDTGMWGDINKAYGNTEKTKKRQDDKIANQQAATALVQLKDGGVVSVSKAKKILKDGTANGQPLTEKQKNYFGWIAGGQKKADGGTIEGPGTGKSDSINASLDAGDFVIPVESSNLAVVKKMMAKLDLNKKAPLSKGDTAVKVSDGEKVIPEEQKASADQILKSLGFEKGLTGLAPNAKSEDEFADGTSEDGIPRLEDTYAFPGATDTVKSDAVLKATTPGTVDVTKIVETTPKKESRTMGSNIDWVSLIGPAQTVVGAGSLLKDGKRPVDTLSPEYNGMVDQAKQAAAYGFDPATGQQYRSNIESARIGNVGLAAQTAGGSAAVANANARLATNQYAKQLLGFASEDARLKATKQQYANALIADRQAKERELFADKLNAFNVNQEAGAGLLNAGLTNIIGANRYQNEKDFYANLAESDNKNSVVTGQQLIK